jgi:hypothetical protein
MLRAIMASIQNDLRDSWFLRIAGDKTDITRSAAWERRKSPLGFAIRQALHVLLFVAAWHHSLAGAGLALGAFAAMYFVGPMPSDASARRGLLARIVEGQRVWVREGSRLARDERDIVAGLILNPQAYVCWGAYFFGVTLYVCWSNWLAASLGVGALWLGFNGLFAWWATRVAGRFGVAGA